MQHRTHTHKAKEPAYILKEADENTTYYICESNKCKFCNTKTRLWQTENLNAPPNHITGMMQELLYMHEVTTPLKTQSSIRSFLKKSENLL